jgi:ABC-2 type transport system permease protein
MKTMNWMLRREIWEHKGSLFWAPVVVAAILVFFTAASAGYGLLMHGAGTFNAMIDGRQVHISDFREIPVAMRESIVQVAGGSYLAAAAPLFVMMAFTIFFYCLSALYDERRDRSVLFWKSLPLSDRATVLSKVVTAAVVAPVITTAVALLMALSLLLIMGLFFAFNGINLFGALLATPALYLAPLYVLGTLPVYILWALPTIGWLLMVSSWAKSKVFLWAVGVPIIALVIVKWVDFLVTGNQGMNTGLTYFAKEVVNRGLGGLVPGIWFAFSAPSAAMRPREHGIELDSVFAQSWMTLAAPGVWIGAAVGIAMIVVAIRMRRWRDEG